MIVSRSKDQGGPATLTLSFGEPIIVSSAPVDRTSLNAAATAFPVQCHSSIHRKEIIDVKNLMDSEILVRLTGMTNATQVNPTLEEEEQAQKLQEEKAKSRHDTLINMKYLERKRQDKAVLDQAKGAVVRA
jgi:hypothetical protein